MTKTDLRSRLESRLAKMVADARAIDMADLADAAEEGAAIVINATMAEVEAIASRLVPDETIRAAVMVRLAERSDLVPWARPFWFDDDKEEDDKEETAHTVMLALVLALVPGPNRAFAWRGLSLDDLSKDDGLASHVAWNLFQAAIDAFIPPADRDAVADVIDRYPGPPADSYTPMEPSGPSSGPLADDWHWQPVPLGTARLVAWFFLQETTPHRLAEHAAKAILAEVKDDIAALPAARRELAREVEDHLEEWASTIAVGETIDEALAGFLERIGGEIAKKGAAEVRQNSAKRSEAENAARWAPGAAPLRVARLLAKALWFDVVAPRLQRLESTHPALARVVHIDVVGILRPGLSIRDDYVVDTDGRQRMMFTQSQALDVPTVEMGALPRLLRRGLELFGSIQAHRIVRHVVVEGHRRAITGEADPRVLRYQGGWSALAAQANVTEADDARAIVVALAHAAHELTDGTHGNLLAYTARRGSPGRPGLVSLTLGDMLLPHFVHSLDPSKARTPTENRRLVPIVDFAGFVGRNNDHAAQATLQMMFMARLRDAAAELAETGTVRITDAEFAALAHDAGLTPALLPKVIDRWTHHGGDAPAFMVKAGDRYTLAPHFAPALAFLEAAGQMSLARSKAGKLSAARKGKPRRKKPAAS